MESEASGMNLWGDGGTAGEKDYNVMEELVQVSYESALTVDEGNLDRFIDHILSVAEVSHTRTSPTFMSTCCLQVRNKRMGITGCMYVDRKTKEVRQVLEGSRRSVTALYKKIKNDRRHFVYHEEPPQRIPSRRFGDWQMQSVERLDMPGYMVTHHERRRNGNPKTGMFDVKTDGSNMFDKQLLPERGTEDVGFDCFD